MLLNWGAREDSWESLGQQGDQTSVKGNQPWIFIGRTDAETPNTLATWWEMLIHWKRPWCWERLKAKGEVSYRGWDNWMASLTQWTWIWANSGRQWRTEEPGVLQSMGLQRVRHDLATEQQAPILWPPDAKSQLFVKDCHAGKDWRQEKKGMKADEMVGWHHWLNVHEFEQTLGNDEGQGSLVCSGQWGHSESDIT